MSGSRIQTKEAIMANRLLSPDSSLFGLSPKPRLRWTPDLHEIFVAAVTQLGGPNEAKPTAIKQMMEAMGVHGLTLRHVKSHLQKYRANYKLAREQASYNVAASSNNTGFDGSMLLPDGNGMPEVYYEPPPTQMLGNNVIPDEMEIENNIQVRKDANDRYLDSFLERACNMSTPGNLETQTNQ